jgi:hypothetical protein
MGGDSRWDRRFFGLCLVAGLAAAAPGCREDWSPPIERLTDARRLAADLRLHFTQAVDASNRAVMADTDEASTELASEAERAKKTVRSDVEALASRLRGGGFEEETRSLEEFVRRFAAYEALDRTVLELAVEHSNHKAQRFSFGPLREAASAMRTALDAVVKAAKAKTSCQVASLVATAELAVADIQVLDAPHIAEADDAVMTKLEGQMAVLERSARAALSALAAVAEPSAQADVAAASAALDRFAATHAGLIVLSRKNTNVHSLTLSFKKRPLATDCDVSLAVLSDGLARRRLAAAR